MKFKVEIVLIIICLCLQLYFLALFQDSDMSIQPLRLSGRSQSMGVIVDSVLPHLVGMSEDILQTGIMLYYLKVRSEVMIGYFDLLSHVHI